MMKISIEATTKTAAHPLVASTVQEKDPIDYTKANGLKDTMPFIGSYLNPSDLSAFEKAFGKTWKGTIEAWYQVLYRKCFPKRVPLEGASFKQHFGEAILEMLALLKGRYGGDAISVNECFEAMIGRCKVPSMDALIALEKDLHHASLEPVVDVALKEERRNSLQKKRCLLAIYNSYYPSAGLLQYTSPLSFISEAELSAALSNISASQLQAELAFVPEADLGAAWSRVPEAMRLGIVLPIAIPMPMMISIASGMKLSISSPRKAELIYALCALDKATLAMTLAQARQEFVALAGVLRAVEPKIFCSETLEKVLSITGSLYAFRKEYGLFVKTYADKQRGTPGEYFYCEPLVFYAERGYLEEVRLLLTSNDSKKFLSLAILRAAAHGHSHIIDALIDKMDFHQLCEYSKNNRNVSQAFFNRSKTLFQNIQELQLCDAGDLMVWIEYFFREKADGKQATREQSELVHAWQEAAYCKLQRHVFSAQNLYIILWIFGQLKIKPEVAFLEAWENAAIVKRDAFNMQHLMSIFCSFIMLKIKPGSDFFEVLQSECITKIETLNDEQLLAISLCFFARLKIRPSAAFLKVWEHRATVQMNEFNAEDLADILYTFGNLGIKPQESFFTAWKHVATVKVNDFNVEDLVKSFSGILLWHTEMGTTVVNIEPLGVQFLLEKTISKLTDCNVHLLKKTNDQLHTILSVLVAHNSSCIDKIWAEKKLKQLERGLKPRRRPTSSQLLREVFDVVSKLVGGEGLVCMYWEARIASFIHIVCSIGGHSIAIQVDTAFDCCNNDDNHEIEHVRLKLNTLLLKEIAGYEVIRIKSSDWDRLISSTEKSDYVKKRLDLFAAKAQIFSGVNRAGTCDTFVARLKEDPPFSGLPQCKRKSF